MTDEELIKKVAEEVMGWSRRELPDGRVGYVIWDDLGSGSYSLRAVDFSFLNANHWLLVVERMRELGYFFRLGNCMERSWAAKFAKDGYGIRLTFEEIYTDVGMAVCEAALKAVENG